VWDQVEGLARQLRCVGIDAASPSEKKSDPRFVPSSYLCARSLVLSV
jgi:hypothetical protein